MRIALEKGIVFNGKHSYDDFKMMLIDRRVGLPSKIKNLETPPYSNVEYDFSLLFGDQPYGQREIVYTFTLFNHHNIPRLEAWRIECVNWLMGVNKQSKLTDDEIEGYYFLGEVREAPECTFDYESDSYEIEVTFICYPFKISENAVGNELWDTFNFETDTFWNFKFEVTKGQTLTIELQNDSITSITPSVAAYIADPPDGSTPAEILEWAEAASLKIVKDGATYAMANQGENAFPGLSLARGLNAMALTGIGTVEFVWHRELL